MLRGLAIVTILLLGLRAAEAQGSWLDEDGGGSATVPANARVLRDLHYGGAKLQTLDVYAPSGARQAPVIVMVHGGGWRLGDKAMGRMVDSKLARWLPRGFVFVSVDYGLLPDTPVSRQVDDVAHALGYVQQHAAAWGGDPRKIIVMGHSAGAHLVALLTASPSRAAAAGVRPWLGTVVLDSAVLDVRRTMQRRHMRLYDAAFGSDPAYWKTLSPIEALEKPAPPLLAVCSTERPDDSCAQAHAFVERARSLGVQATVLEEALTHGEVNFTLGTAGAYTEAVEAFMKTLDADVRRRLERLP